MTRQVAVAIARVSQLPHVRERAFRFRRHVGERGDDLADLVERHAIERTVDELRRLAHARRTDEPRQPARRRRDLPVVQLVRILLSLEPGAARTRQSFIRHQGLALHRALLAHPHAIPLFATRPAATPAAIERLDQYLGVLLHAGFNTMQALSIVQLVAQLVVGHAMWSTGVEIVLVGEDAPANVKQAERALVKWNPDKELELGLDAMIHGFERLLA